MEAFSPQVVVRENSATVQFQIADGYYLYKNKIGKADLQKLQSEQWHELQKEAESFATHVCQSIENCVSVEFGKKKAPTR